MKSLATILTRPTSWSAIAPALPEAAAPIVKAWYSPAPGPAITPWWSITTTRPAAQLGSRGIASGVVVFEDELDVLPAAKSFAKRAEQRQRILTFEGAGHIKDVQEYEGAIIFLPRSIRCG